MPTGSEETLCLFVVIVKGNTHPKRSSVEKEECHKIQQSFHSILVVDSPNGYGTGVSRSPNAMTLYTSPICPSFVPMSLSYADMSSFRCSESLAA